MQPQVVDRGAIATGRSGGTRRAARSPCGPPAPAAGDTGRLSLYAVDPATGRADLGSPMLEDEPALGAFTLDRSQLVWPAPGEEGKRDRLGRRAGTATRRAGCRCRRRDGHPLGRPASAVRRAPRRHPRAPSPDRRRRGGPATVGPGPSATLRRSCDAARSSRPRRSWPPSPWPACRPRSDPNPPRPRSLQPATFTSVIDPRGRPGPRRPGARPSSPPAGVGRWTRPYVIDGGSARRARAGARRSTSPTAAGSAWKPPRRTLSGFATFYDNGTTAMRLPRGHGRPDLRRRRLHPAHGHGLRPAGARRSDRRPLPPGLLPDLRLPVVVGHDQGHRRHLLTAPRGRLGLDFRPVP